MPQPLPAPPNIGKIKTLEEADNAVATLLTYLDSLRQTLERVDYRSHAPVVATADLPAAGAEQNGNLVIEDAGAGDRNLIIYAGGQRFRIDGGVNF